MRSLWSSTISLLLLGFATHLPVKISYTVKTANAPMSPSPRYTFSPAPTLDAPLPFAAVVLPPLVPAPLACVAVGLPPLVPVAPLAPFADGAGVALEPDPPPLPKYWAQGLEAVAVAPAAVAEASRAMRRWVLESTGGLSYDMEQGE